MMFRDIATVCWRDWVVLKRRLVKFILSRMVAPLLYLTAFGWGLGRSVQLASGSYLDYIVPGIMALNSMNMGFHSIIPVHAERVYHKSLEEYLLSPISPSAFLIGKILGAVFRGVVSSVIIIVLARLFGATVEFSLPMLAVIALNTVIFAEVGFCAAMRLSSYEEMAQVNTYVLLPMSFMCGTFFATAALPTPVRVVVDVLPLTHAGLLLRTLGNGGGIVLISVAALLLYAACGFWLSRRALNRLGEE